MLTLILENLVVIFYLYFRYKLGQEEKEDLNNNSGSNAPKVKINKDFLHKNYFFSGAIWLKKLSFKTDKKMTILLCIFLTKIYFLMYVFFRNSQIHLVHH